MEDERIKHISFFRRSLMRPELGSICGVILVLIFFLLIATDNGMFNPDGISSICNYCCRGLLINDCW